MTTIHKPLRGEITVPGDKSISHRGVMFGSISQGTTEITGFLNSADCNSTINCFQKMGVDITRKDEHTVLVTGKGMRGLTAPASFLDAGNSGTAFPKKRSNRCPASLGPMVNSFIRFPIRSGQTGCPSAV